VEVSDKFATKVKELSAMFGFFTSQRPDKEAKKRSRQFMVWCKTKAFYECKSEVSLDRQDIPF
jgi:hypothetical protein